ncbi:hypothetical protein [Corynebacterium renale]|uniref:Uncharacterized protein n=1 Tax=Corynebacterium renale TaxID=1724 RepID=A0A2A9DL59_9CORY|nr:hypothetical protein [Corynebacterium renale]PFG27333.1 hypothetical protein ATK06_0389 [Corynebacterium renale]SQI23580.1 hypothetical membrane protein [Corynebacterium renale]
MSESDKQLTVAELLARSGSQPKEGGRRRRRRLEEGGVSVAELTGSLPKVTEAPADSRHTAQPLEAENADRPEPVAIEETATFEAVSLNDAPPAAEPAEEKEPEAPVEEPVATDTVVEKPAEDTEIEAEGLERPAADTEVTGEIKVVEDTPAEAEEDVEDSIAGFEYPDQDEEVAELEEDEEESSVGMGSVILMALVGIVLGAVVFIGFQFLWESGLSRLIVAVLALAVTALMVGVAHAMRTSRDGLSMVLAGVVGLLMTFGPAIVVMM